MIKRIKHLLFLEASLTLYNWSHCSIMETLFGSTKIMKPWWVNYRSYTEQSDQGSFRLVSSKLRYTGAFNSLQLKPLSNRRLFHWHVTMYKWINGETGFNFRSNASLHSYHIGRKNELNLPSARTNRGKQKFIYHAAKDWNNFDENFRNIPL